MSTSRHGDAEHPRYDRRARGPNGRRTCRRCLAEVPKGRSTFCGDACVEAFQIATGAAGWVRPVVERRDHGVCADCGLNTQALGRLFQWVQRTQQFTADERLRMAALLGRSPDEWMGSASWWYWRCCVLIRYGWTPPQAMEHRALWEADHIVPVVEGGGGCGLENYRTLCRGCHNKQTAALARRRADGRRAGRRQTVGGVA